MGVFAVKTAGDNINFFEAYLKVYLNFLLPLPSRKLENKFTTFKTVLKCQAR